MKTPNKNLPAGYRNRANSIPRTMSWVLFQAVVCRWLDHGRFGGCAQTDGSQFTVHRPDAVGLGGIPLQRSFCVKGSERIRLYPQMDFSRGVFDRWPSVCRQRQLELSGCSTTLLPCRCDLPWLTLRRWHQRQHSRLHNRSPNSYRPGW